MRALESTARARRDACAFFERERAIGSGITLADGAGMKTSARFILGAIALAAISGCTSETDDETTTVETQSEALRNTGGGSGDPDECMAQLGACYQMCAKSGSSSCYRYCDIVYSKCRGLPSPELTMMR